MIIALHAQFMRVVTNEVIGGTIELFHLIIKVKCLLQKKLYWGFFSAAKLHWISSDWLWKVIIWKILKLTDVAIYEQSPGNITALEIAIYK